MATAKKPKKRKGFPLYPHAVGQWAKTINYDTYYFGPWDNPDAALEKYNREVANIRAGKPRNTDTPAATEVLSAGLTLKELVNRFLNFKRKRIESGELSARTHAAYERTAVAMARFFGEHCLVTALTSSDFERYREYLSSGVKKTVGAGKRPKTVKRNLTSITNEIRNAKVVLNWAWDQRLIPQPLPLKAWLEPPAADKIRAEANAKPLRMLEADELRSVLCKASIPLRAMILLGINCGFGQADVSAIPRTAVDLSAGWLNFPRPKTSVKRTCPLWPETVDAIKASLAKGRKVKDSADAGLLFITKYGQRYVKATDSGAQIDSIALEFGKLLRELGLKRKGLNFYCLRSTFETVAGDTGDQIATDYVMGHTPKSNDMAAVYRRKLFEPRLRKITDYVRLWVWPQGSEEAWLQTDEAKGEKAAAEAKKP